MTIEMPFHFDKDMLTKYKIPFKCTCFWCITGGINEELLGSRDNDTSDIEKIMEKHNSKSEDSESEKALDELTKQAQELDMGY